MRLSEILGKSETQVEEYDGDARGHKLDRLHSGPVLGLAWLVTAKSRSLLLQGRGRDDGRTRRMPERQGLDKDSK